MSSYVNRNRTVKQGGRIRRKGEKKTWREGRKKGRGKTERETEQPHIRKSRLCMEFGQSQQLFIVLGRTDPRLLFQDNPVKLGGWVGRH